MIQEYEHTKLDFEATEDAKRKKFYEIHGFKEQLKLEDTRDEEGIKDKPKRVKPHIQHEDHNDDETEQEIQ